MQLDYPALIFGQARQRCRQLKKFLLTPGLFAGGGLICHEPIFQTGGGLLQVRFQGALAGHIACFGTVAAN
jgi:hypothetical protein